jgi:MFS family permease
LEKRQRFFYGWVVLAAAIIILVLGYSLRNTFSVFYPTIVEEFGWSRGDTALMFSFAIVVYGLVAPLAGRLADRFEPRFVITAGACIVGGSIALCGLAKTEWQFYLLYGVLAAAGLSLMGWTPFTAIISNWFAKKRGLAFGILSAGFGGSLVLAPIAQYFISKFGWRTAYVIMGISSTVIIVPICALLIRPSPRKMEVLPGNISNTSHKEQSPGGPQMSTDMEGRWSGTTWTLTRALKTYQFWFLFCIAFCILGLTEQIVIAHQIYFFRDVGYKPMAAAGIVSVFGVVFVVGNFCSVLSDFLGRERVFISSCLLTIGAVVLLFLIKDPSQIWMPLLFAILCGLGLGNAGPVLFTTVADLFQGRSFGSIMGAVVLGFSLGGAISPWLAGFLHDRTGSYFSTFLILLGSTIVAMVLMALIAYHKVWPDSSRAKTAASAASHKFCS